MIDSQIRYLLDDQDTIVEVGKDWEAFARANDGGHLCGNAVIGTGFWTHVSGERVRELLERLFARARRVRQPITVRARCDSPQTIREIELTLHAPAGDRLEVISRVVAERTRPQSAPLDDARMLLQMCSWCNRFCIHGEWLEIEQAADRLELTRYDLVPAISHGICQDCTDSLQGVAGTG